MQASRSKTSRDILLCAYGFPPIAGPTERRWAEFVRFLAGRGWKIDVLTIRVPDSYYRLDNASLSLIEGENIRVYRTYPGPFHGLIDVNAMTSDKTHSLTRGSKVVKQFYNKLLRPLVVPDRMVAWFPFALREARRLLKHNSYKVVVSSSFPHTSHLIGLFAHRLGGVPWVGDWSDPLAFNPHDDFSWWQRKLNRLLELRFLNQMDKIVVSTKETKEAYLAEYPAVPAKKIAVINYGYSEEAFARIAPEPADRFRIVYTGVFFKNIRTPYAFFDGLKLVRDLPIEVLIAGLLEPEYRRYLEVNGLQHLVKALGQLPHAQSIALQKGASVLLLVGNSGSIQLPGKVFEYIAARRPVLALKNDDHDIAADLVERFKRGIVVANKADDIGAAIRKLFRAYQERALDTTFDLHELSSFSWSSNAREFEELLRMMLSESGLNEQHR